MLIQNYICLTSVERLISIGGKDLVMVRDVEGCTALHECCKKKGVDEKNIANHSDTIRVILNQGGSDLLMATDNFGMTALHTACRHVLTSHDCNIIKLLLERGGKDLLAVKDAKNKCTALHTLSLKCPIDGLKMCSWMREV
mmetsp:Transcript_12302/g.23058  ORF Transcript_12302/g.23058 Transcript_12302/m.23058 type:complete len:141 (+) Transcript_12302:1044-1466(+)